MKYYLSIILLINLLQADINPKAFQFSGIKVVHKFLDGSTKEFKIQREISSECMKIQISPDNFSNKNIKNHIPSKCKREFIITSGVIQPFIYDEKVKTIGENEVLQFIFEKASKKPDKYALVDSRKAIWFNQETIPSAISVPLEDLTYDEDFEEDFYKAYENLGVKVLGKNKFDFTRAKTVVFFCNGAWCPISSKSMDYLISIGFPKEKMLWYRGGIASWSGLSLTTTKK